MDQLGHDRRLARAGVAGDQQGRLAARHAPGVDLVEEPLAPAEPTALFVEERGKVPRPQVVLPRAIAHFAPPGRFQGVQEPRQARLVLVLRILPRLHVDVVEPEDAKRRLARPGHHRHDRLGRRGEPGEADLVEADAVRPARVTRIGARPDGVRAEQGHDDLRAPQPVDDLVLPIRPGADLAGIAPDLVAVRRQVDAEAVGQVRRVEPPVAEEQLRSRRRALGLLRHDKSPPVRSARGRRRFAGVPRVQCIMVVSREGDKGRRRLAAHDTVGRAGGGLWGWRGGTGRCVGCVKRTIISEQRWCVSRTLRLGGKDSLRSAAGRWCNAAYRGGRSPHSLWEEFLPKGPRPPNCRVDRLLRGEVPINTLRKCARARAHLRAGPRGNALGFQGECALVAGHLRARHVAGENAFLDARSAQHVGWKRLVFPGTPSEAWHNL